MDFLRIVRRSFVAVEAVAVVVDVQEWKPASSSDDCMYTPSTSSQYLLVRKFFGRSKRLEG